MNGAEALVRTLVDAGVDVCFMNPGTSEMHFVAALDAVPEMRGVLALFEGVATGAADGYARIAGKPAATLLHCGPGLMNGLANLHNARRARSGIVNIVGDQATRPAIGCTWSEARSAPACPWRPARRSAAAELRAGGSVLDRSGDLTRGVPDGRRRETPARECEMHASARRGPVASRRNTC